MSLLLVAADEAAILAAATASRAHAGVEAVEADFATIEDQDMKRYAYGWITILFFLVSIAGHWIFGWYAFLQEAAEHAQQPVFSEYAIEMGRDTLENWQSEFLQLLWQVVGSLTSST